MKLHLGISLGASLLLLGACQQGGHAPDPSGGAAADMGAGYCDAPADPAQIDHWNQTCMPGPR